MQRQPVTLSPLNPNQYGSLNGHYRSVFEGGGIAPNAGAKIFTVRWVAPTAPTTFTSNQIVPAQFFVPLKISVAITTLAAVTAQQLRPLKLFVARGYTANETTAETSPTLSGNDQKAKTAFAGSNFISNGQICVNTATAAGISGGTKTLDDNPFAMSPIVTTGGAGAALTGIGNNPPQCDLYAADVVHQKYPLILGNNEGFVIQWGDSALATGQIFFSVELDWAEVSVY